MKRLSCRFLVFFLLAPRTLLGTANVPPLPPSPAGPPCTVDLVAVAAELQVVAAMKELERSASPAELAIYLSGVYFSDMRVPTDRGERTPLPVRFLELRDMSLFYVLQAYVRQIQELTFPQLLPLMTQTLQKIYGTTAEGATPYRDQVLARLRAAAEDPEIFLRYAQMEVEHSVRQSVSWTQVFTRLPKLAHLAPALLDVAHPMYPDRSFFWSRPQQVMLALNVYMNSQTKPGDRILEIGYGSPSVLLTLTTLIPGITGIGVDTNPLPPAIHDGLKPVGLELVSGNIPTDPAAMSAVRAKGPYAIVYAGDAIFPQLPGGAKFFEPKVDGLAYAKMLYELTQDGGNVILLNDFGRLPYFTEEEARTAGFHVVRWNVPRFLTRRAIELTAAASGYGNIPKLGELRLFVLRRGGIDRTRVRTREEQEKDATQ